ncbi:hypothetical protein IGI37_003072 [Enterococcus sp. AZ194]|uniref:DUF1861 family protein n=1 Tax=Enterococcus sp. AZ194 TaxID=2774629 RepID=UPI003F298699
MIYSRELLDEYRENKRFVTKTSEVLHFTGVEGYDVYNITAPFTLAGQVVLAGRIEQRDSEVSSVGLFKQTSETTWAKISEGLDLPLQDPFYTKIDGKIILGGVDVVFSEDGQAKWRTMFYQLENTSEVKQLFAGPWGMKDLRLKQLNTGEIIVLTRPQGEKGGRGKIGALVINHLSELTLEKIENAPLLLNQFCEEEWGGANEIYQMGEDIWVLGHIANFDEQGNRHYYAMSFCFDRSAHAMTQPKIIAERNDFSEGPTKRPDLEDVVFSGGLSFTNKRVVLYAGISDAGAQKLEIENPFK